MHWFKNRQILSDAHKKETAEKILETLDGLSVNDARAILAFVYDSLGERSTVNFLPEQTDCKSSQTPLCTATPTVRG